MVSAPSVDISIQDLHDTLRFLEDSPEGEGEDLLIESAGKEPLGGGITVGITATLLNTQLAFEPRHLPVAEGAATSGDPSGQSLIDTGADFIADGVVAGSTVVNYTDGSSSTVFRVVSPTELFLHPLDGGTDNEWDIADVYKVFVVVQCIVSGGNLVALDDLGAPINPIFPTSFTQVNIAASSSATIATPESAFTQGEDFPDFSFTMLSTTTRLPQPSLTVTGRKGIGGVWSALANAVTEDPDGGGKYRVDLSGALDLTARKIELEFTAAGAVPRRITIICGGGA
jgi:hypothetical protein